MKRVTVIGESMCAKTIITPTVVTSQWTLTDKVDSELIVSSSDRVYLDCRPYLPMSTSSTNITINNAPIFTLPLTRRERRKLNRKK